ncbi:hypothetical protein FMK97_05790 [Klebsiella variicola]|uniref:ead/Ea22-like family protein n=1 Tax=Klebsiella variicola TaxID=244366 RepID=UPI001CD00B5C|nr:ead/Ea22-like family protein [Klebsiella variicola]MBZ7529875.1 hypothetical protein [Klebsiella variicola]
MTTDITELAQSLKAAAEKATPGRWEYYPGNTSIEYNVDSMDEDQGSIVYVDSGDFTQAQTDRNGEFIALANPVNVLALVEALEKAKRTNAAQDDHINQQQDRIEQLERGNRYAAKRISSWRRLAKQSIAEQEKCVNELDAARQRIVELDRKNSELDSLTQRWAVELAENAERIAELESRTVTVKLPDIMPPEAAPAHYWGSGESMAYADGYNKSAADLKTSFAQACSSVGVNVEFE